MVDNAKVPRAQEVDENRNVVQGGTTVEIQIMTCTASDMLPMNFSEKTKGVVFQTRTGATDVEFSLTSTTPNSAAGVYYTMRAGEELSIDISATGTFYFRNSAANQGSVVIGTALL